MADRKIKITRLPFAIASQVTQAETDLEAGFFEAINRCDNVIVVGVRAGVAQVYGALIDDSLQVQGALLEAATSYSIRQAALRTEK